MITELYLEDNNTRAFLAGKDDDVAGFIGSFLASCPGQKPESFSSSPYHSDPKQTFICFSFSPNPKSIYVCIRKDVLDELIAERDKLLAETTTLREQQRVTNA